MRRTFQILMLALVAGPLASPATAQKGVHRDARIGFEIKPPRGWNQVPVSSAEEWIVAQYQSDKEEQVYNKQDKFSWTHKPRLVVIALLDEAIKRGDVEVEKDSGEARVRIGPVFADYSEYAKSYFKTSYGLGFFESASEETTVDGMPVRCLELDCEGMLTAVVWVFETEIGRVAVQLECPSDKLDKYKRDFTRTLKSFERIERTEPLNIGASTGGFISLALFRDLSPEDRKLRRQEQERQEWAAMSANNPEGWSIEEIDGVNVVTHADKKHAAKVVAHIKAVRAWLDETFPNVGPGEYARMPNVRICEDADEEGLFLSGPGFLAGTALITHKDTTAGATSSEWGVVGERTMRMWFLDHDSDLYFNLPGWVIQGLVQVISTATVRGKKIEFNADWFERLIKDYLREHGDPEPTPARVLMGLRRGDPDWRGIQRRYDAMCLTRLLVNTRNRKYRDILPSYLDNLKAVLEEMRQEDKDSDDKLEKPKNEEEEEAYFAEQKRRAEALEERLLEEVASRTFADWSEGDWKSFENEFQKSK